MLGICFFLVCFVPTLCLLQLEFWYPEYSVTEFVFFSVGELGVFLCVSGKGARARSLPTPPPHHSIPTLRFAFVHVHCTVQNGVIEGGFSGILVLAN